MTDTGTPAIDMKRTGKAIRERLEKKGLTVRDVQDACCLTTGNAIYKWLNGLNLPAIDNLVILAWLLGCRVDDLLVLEDKNGFH